MQTNTATMSREELIAWCANLESKVDTMTKDAQRKLSCKVSEKGAVSVYGLGRFPVTLYQSQWEQFIPFVKSGVVDRFIEANRAALSVKGE